MRPRSLTLVSRCRTAGQDPAQGERCDEGDEAMASRQAISVQPIRRGGRRKPEEWSAPESRDSGSPVDQGLVNFLGWFSVGLGLTEILMPRSFARFIGTKDDDADCAILRMFGLRELASGVGILTRPRPAGWLW